MFTALLSIAYFPFAARRLLTYLHIFQQEEYDGRRFLHWVWKRRAIDRKATAVLILVGATALAFGVSLSAVIAPSIVSLGFLIVAAIEKNPLKAAKKPLVLTARARRILVSAMILLVLLASLLAALGAPLLLWIIAVQAVPVALVVGNTILQPYENRVQQAFWKEANDKLRHLKPTIVGITGSFGKTSMKHILHHVLATQASTLVTPGSVNTPMGIARIVRERMTPRHRYFVCEMGAYGPGSIERLCKLAPPNMGVITAVGHAHYERFRSLDSVARTKLELANAVMINRGRTVISEQVLEVPYARDFVDRHRTEVSLVGKGEEADLKILAIRQSAAGIEVDIERNNERLTLKAPLFGEHQGINVALAFVVAESLGVSREDIVVALSSTPQIEHRLEVKRQSDGTIIVDDAYNSNPIGFANGLALLDILRKNGGRRILVTPGMVELGEAHDAEHCKIGRLAGSHVDILLPVIPERIESMISSYKAAHADGIVVPCQSFADARTWMTENLRVGDVLLLENDLPDLYEVQFSL